MNSLRLRCLALAAALSLTGAAVVNAADNPAAPLPQVPVAVDPVGVWKWTTQGRNGQPEETVLKLALERGGTVTGTLTDRAGPHSITNVSFNGGTLDFTILRETPNGRVPVEYSLKLDAKIARIAVDYPDSAPAAKRMNKKRRVESEVTREEPKPNG